MEAYERLEGALARWAGYPLGHAVVCSSGTAALHLALEALRLPPGSEILIPDFGMIACPRAASLAGLTPVFVDCADDLLMDLDLVDRAIAARKGRVRAVMAVHIYGRRCDMDGLHALADKYDLHVVEDLAEAHGVPPHEATDAAAYSFYRNKVIHGEEGGAVCFRCPGSAALARQLRSLGFTEAHDYTHTPRGHNYRLSNVHAELILSSLDRFPENVESRREIERWYDAECPDEWRMPPRDAVWVVDVRIPGLTSQRQDELVSGLNLARIAARHAFKPMSSQAEYRNCRAYHRGDGNAFRLSREVIYLPAVPGVTTRASAVKAFDLIRRVVGAARPVRV